MTTKSRMLWSGFGALTTAGTVAATILCCVPFATGLIGAGIAAAGARFVPLHPYLIAFSLGLLGYTFYHAYRPAPCSTDACELPSAVRRRRVALWMVSLVVCAMLTASWWANWLIYWSL